MSCAVLSCTVAGWLLASVVDAELAFCPVCPAPFFAPHRLFNLPLGPETCKSNISAIRSTDVNRYLCLSGTVIRTGVVKMLEAEREYECAKCKHRFRVFSQIENGNTITLPKSCGSSENGKKCNSTVFNYIEGSRVCRDYQEIKLQEQVQRVRGLVLWCYLCWCWCLWWRRR